MPVEKFATAAAAIAASAVSNVMTGRKTQQKPYDRVLQGIVIAETDNTPVIGELSYVLFFGDQEVGRGRSTLAQTTGGEFRFPDDFDPVNVVLPGGLNLSIEVTNGDGAAAHGALVALAWDRF